MFEKNESNFKDLLLNEENINSVLLSAKGNSHQLIEYLIQNIYDQKELLAKLKILALNKQIKSKTKIDIEWGLCEDIVTNIFAAIEFKNIVIPHDIIKMLAQNPVFNRKVSKWYFTNREFKTEISDKIIEYVIRFLGKNQVNNLIEERNTVINVISTHEKQFFIDISTIKKDVLENHDKNIQKQLALVAKEQINLELLNRCVDVIKILIVKNKTKSIKLFRKLHDIDTLQKVNYKNKKIGPLLKIYFKNLKTANSEELFNYYLKTMQKDPACIKYCNHIHSFVVKNNIEFKWEKFFKSVRTNEHIKQLDLIDFKNIPSPILYETVYKDINLKRYKNLILNTIKNEIDINLLNLYHHKFSEKDNHFYKKLCKYIKKRAEQISGLDI